MPHIKSNALTSTGKAQHDEWEKGRQYSLDRVSILPTTSPCALYAYLAMPTVLFRLVREKLSETLDMYYERFVSRCHAIRDILAIFVVTVYYHQVPKDLGFPKARQWRECAVLPMVRCIQ